MGDGILIFSSNAPQTGPSGLILTLGPLFVRRSFVAVQEPRPGSGRDPEFANFASDPRVNDVGAGCLLLKFHLAMRNKRLPHDSLGALSC